MEHWAGDRDARTARRRSGKSSGAGKPLPLASRLLELRRKAKRSMVEVAEAAGISRQHVWRIENGSVPNPSPEILTRLASVYGLSLAESGMTFG